MFRKILWFVDLVLATIALYWVGSCVGEHIGNKIPEVFGLEEE